MGLRNNAVSGRLGRRGAFTLTELLVVVGIVGVLIAMVTPSFLQIQALARLTKCCCQIQAQVRAHALYRTRFGGPKPPLMVAGGSSSWRDWVSPRTKSLRQPVGQGLLVSENLLPYEALLCPAASMANDTAVDRDAWETGINAGSSYAYFWQHPQGQTGDVVMRATYTHAAATDRTAVTMDVNAAKGHQYTGDYAGGAWPSHPWLDKVNVGFLDGAVRTFESRTLKLQPPGDWFMELLWFEEAHKRAP